MSPIIRLEIEEVQKIQKNLEVYKEQPYTATYQDSINVLKNWRDDRTLTLSEDTRALIESLLEQYNPRRSSKGRWG